MNPETYFSLITTNQNRKWIKMDQNIYFRADLNQR